MAAARDTAPLAGAGARMRWLAALLGVGLALPSHAARVPAAVETVQWPEALREQLERIDAAYPGDLGVYVQDLDSGATLSYRGAETWYLASGIKVFIAVAVMRRVDVGGLRLDTRIALEDGDYVDGAGPTALAAPGTRITVRTLLERMLVLSDNTASDALIRVVGLDRVDAVAHELAFMPQGRVTRLADVRRLAYGGFHPGAAALTGKDLLALRKAGDAQARIALLSRLLGVPASEFALHDIDDAFEAYYATGYNSAPLVDYANLWRSLAEGRALPPASTTTLLDILGRVETGAKRIRAGLPRGVAFAHKTGTQLARTCDSGLVTVAGVPRSKRLVVVACTRGDPSLVRSEHVLRDVGAALADSGALAHATGTQGDPP